jgi:Na+-driven multidrug efflux pump
MLAGSVCVSIALDPLLIIGIGPIPHLGVEGAALASVMVRGGGFVLGLVIALRRGLLRIDAPDWRSLPTIIRIGAPLSLSGVLLSVVYMWLTRFTSRFGTPALAALGVGHKMEGLGFIAIGGFALAGAGYTFWPQIASTTLTALRIPLAAWWSSSFGLLGIWLALSITAIARGIAMTLFWKGGRWRAIRV